MRPFRSVSVRLWNSAVRARHLFLQSETMMLRLITESGAARLLALTSNDIRRLVRSGLIPTVELPGGETRFDPEEVRRWAATFRRAAVPRSPARETITA